MNWEKDNCENGSWAEAGREVFADMNRLGGNIFRAGLGGLKHTGKRQEPGRENGLT